MPSGFDNDPKPLEIELEFSDGWVTCLGTITLPDNTELMGVDEQGTIHQSSYDVEIHIIQDGEIHMDGDTVDLEPGDYLLNDRGLWRRVDVAA